MSLLILGHILGDFYIQTDRVAENKKNSARCMLLHCSLYMICMYILLVVFTGDMIRGLEIAFIIGFSHMCVDILKVKIAAINPKAEYAVFLLDQILHILILILIAWIFMIPEKINNFFYSNFFWTYNIQKGLMIVVAGLICWKPAAIFVSLVFKVIPKTIEDADREVQNCIQVTEESPKYKQITEESPKCEQVTEESQKYNLKTAVNKSEDIKIGSWIGILEREIILILGLMGQYGAIGFVLAAKSLARYKQLENKSFAEKYLVGTLLSALIAIASIVICSFFN